MKAIRAGRFVAGAARSALRAAAARRWRPRRKRRPVARTTSPTARQRVSGTVNPGGERDLLLLPVRPDARLRRPERDRLGRGRRQRRARSPSASRGLQPLTVYHYRLVAVNASGTSFGKDHTFQTTKVPLSLSILASPNPVSYGAPVTVQGTLSGTGNAGRQVILQGRPFPFTAPFAADRQPRADDGRRAASASRCSAPRRSMQFQVVTTTKPVVASLDRHRERRRARLEPPVAHPPPRLRPRLRHGHPRRGRRRRSGSCGSSTATACSPAARCCATTARPSSSFSRVVRVHKGIYRVLVRVVGRGPGLRTTASRC